MIRTKYISLPEKMFTPWMLLLCAIGLGINVLLVYLVRVLGLPLYLDNVGSVLVGVWGGVLPGIAIGFLSNLVNSYDNPLTMYYGILTVLIAWTGTMFSQQGALRQFRGFLLMAACFVFIGGCMGACVTWGLYGGAFGDDVGASVALYLYGQGLTPFWSQFIAPTLMDIPDKLLTVLFIYGATVWYPAMLYDKFPLSYLYDRPAEAIRNVQLRQRSRVRRYSINFKITAIIVTSAVLTGAVSVTMGFMYYRERLLEQYRSEVSNSSRLAASLVPGDQVEAFLSEKEKAPGYGTVRTGLRQLLDNTSGLAYIYVYQFNDDGCRVVFDLDTPTIPADPVGTAVSFDESFESYRADIVAGNSIPPVISHDRYGWLITAYTPVRNHEGRTVAYAGADIHMERYVNDLLVYGIKSAAMLFGFIMVFAAFSLWFAQRKLVDPINAILDHSQRFKQSDPGIWLDSLEWRQRPQIRTGDEIEELYGAVCNTEQEISHKVRDLRTTQLKLRESEAIKRKNEELALAVRRADEANAAKTVFLSNVSHDMRTPLNAIIGFSRMGRETEVIEEKNDCLDKIILSGDFLLNLINDTLSLSKLETATITLSPHPVMLEEFINQMLTGIRIAARARSITVRSDISRAGVKAIQADSLRVQEIFLNLLSNAVKFTPEGGRIDFQIQQERREGDRIWEKFVVRDTGIGMSPEFLPHLFEPFSQENAAGSGNTYGSGLGLAIVKKLVDLMEGNITVTSSPGKGTSYEVILPFHLVQTLPPAEERRRTCYDESILHGTHVLLCDDHPLNRELGQYLLRQKGVIVTCACDGRECLDIFSGLPTGTFDAILMDIRMPVMDGLQAAKAIRALERPDASIVPIIALTANAFTEDRQETEQAGMNAHLGKPVVPDQLYQVLAREILAAQSAK